MTFKDLHLTNALWNALDDAGLETHTPIQYQSLPVIMSGRDVQGIAQTGTGKTIAYLLPLFRLLNFSRSRNPQVMVVVPTRELVVQVAQTAQKLSKYQSVVTKGVFGGTNLRTQAAELAEGCDVIVGTPGRLLDLMYHGVLNTKSIRKLVIDEVDEMLALGFRSQLENILELLPEKRQNLLFSATISDDVENVLDEYFQQPVRVEAAPPGTPVEKISQSVYRVPNNNTKVNLLKWLLENHPEMSRILLFVSTKALADELFSSLSETLAGQVGVIHSNKDQNYRFQSVRNFQEGKTRILIATDIIARGIDIADVSHVINFDLPEVPQHYIHRIGRTGRADKEGIAISLVSDQDAALLEEIEAMMQYQIPVHPHPEDVVISTVLTESEIPRVQMKNILGKTPVLRENQTAFHDKKAKNKKTNQKVSHKEKMMAKYGKPKTRGQKRK